MLDSQSNWKFIKHINDSLDDTLHHSPLIHELLQQRGIYTENEAESFLNPNIKNLHSPQRIEGIEKASERVHEAIQLDEKILIYGDYDADGVCSTAILMQTLRELGARCDFYIPNRFTEGYGPNEQAFKDAAQAGVDVIITVDTGIAAIHEAEVAHKVGIDLIITDHHDVQQHLPSAYAIIHPNLSPNYPFKELAGAGVAFKFAEHLLGYFPEQLLDLVAIGTIADLVPLRDENRILTYHGLRKIWKTNRPGLQALKKNCNLSHQVTEEDIGFKMGPRLNAAGRLQDADIAVHLLVTDDVQEAEHIADVIEQLNIERQQMVTQIVKEAEQMVDVTKQKEVIIVGKEGWNEGVLGIVASRLVNTFHRPAIVLAIDKATAVAKGSARSIPAFHLFDNCMEVKDLFTSFGGHAQAAGMTLPVENIRALQAALNDRMNEKLTADDFKQTIEIHRTLSISEIDEALVREIEQLAPFGIGNPKPLFHVKHVPNYIRQLGALKNHLKIHFNDTDSRLEGIGFGMGDLHSYIAPETPVSIVGELGINEWNGKRTVQMIIEDIKVDQWQLFDHRGRKLNDLQSHIQPNKRVVAVNSSGHSTIGHLSNDVKQLMYDDDLRSITEADTLLLFDLPPTLNTLKQIVQLVKPTNIHACFYIEESTYLAPMPSRKDFKWLYVQIYKRKQLHVNNELPMIMDAKNWSKEYVHFMIKVFLELQFVVYDQGVLTLHPSPVKQDLSSSKTYQERINQATIEKTLYYSTYDDLKQWFEDCMVDIAPKEEVTYGL
ncbi:MAG TPA: single-stranded-DNA-specific exonuclease RecJ [Bacillota bacterium]